jgi:hypothetical protein
MCPCSNQHEYSPFQRRREQVWTYGQVLASADEGNTCNLFAEGGSSVGHTTAVLVRF